MNISLSKVEHLKVKWGDNTLTAHELAIYNKWFTSTWHRIMTFEVHIEQFVYETLSNFKDWGVRSPFIQSPAAQRQLASIYTGKDFNHLGRKNAKRANQMIANERQDVKAHFQALSKDQQFWVDIILKKATIGKKITIFKYLKSKHCPNKGLIFAKGVNQADHLNYLENLRNIRNALAHLESKKMVLKKLRKMNPIDAKSHDDKITRTIKGFKTQA